MRIIKIIIIIVIKLYDKHRIYLEIEKGGVGKKLLYSHPIRIYPREEKPIKVEITMVLQKIKFTRQLVKMAIL